MHIYLTPIQIPKWIFCYNKVHNKFVHVANSRQWINGSLCDFLLSIIFKLCLQYTV